jgi:hypothetical protein
METLVGKWRINLSKSIEGQAGKETTKTTTTTLFFPMRIPIVPSSDSVFVQ